jgi:hypothetical protein
MPHKIQVAVYETDCDRQSAFQNLTENFFIQRHQNSVFHNSQAFLP